MVSDGPLFIFKDFKRKILKKYLIDIHSVNYS